MTTGALSAGVLEKALAGGQCASPRLPRQFFRAQANLVRDAWSIAAGADFRLATTPGRRPPGFAWATRAGLSPDPAAAARADGRPGRA